MLGAILFFLLSNLPLIPTCPQWEEDESLQKAWEVFSIPRGQRCTGDLGGQLLSPC